MAPSGVLIPDTHQLTTAIDAIRSAKNPLIISGGGVHYSDACDALKTFAETHQIPVAETQAGKSALAWDHPLNFGSIGVTGASSANALAENADLVIGVGTRFQDFTTGSWALFKNPKRKILTVNIASYDSAKHNALPLIADAKVALEALSKELGTFKASAPDETLRGKWLQDVETATSKPGDDILPTDAQVIGAVQRCTDDKHHHLMCSWWPSGGAAQALEGLPTQRLSHGIRLFLHGL